MALVNRVTRLFRADLHAVLDRIEEPDVVLRQSVREMSEAISNDERSIKLIEQEQQQQLRHEEEINESLKRLNQQLDVCFAAEQEDLARGLIRRKLEAERLLSALNFKGETRNTRLVELQQGLQENRPRLLSMQQKLEIFVLAEANSETYSNPGEGNTDQGITVGDDEVEVAFLAEQQQRVSS